jgi:SM-20-related protein
MDVVVKLSLQSGHKWEFCCDQDDPIIIGLMSALPGADLGSNLPVDGLIQLETRTGERLFLTRASLVAISVVPVNDHSELFTDKFLVTTVKTESQASKPASFVMVPDALPSEVHRALIDQTLSYGAREQLKNGICELSLGGLDQPVTRALQRHLNESLAHFGISESPEIPLQIRLVALGNGGSISWEKESKEGLSLVYHFHKHPRAFTGGGVRLFDSKGGANDRATFRDVEISNNAALIFPGDLVRAGLPVYSDGNFTDSLFVLQGSLGGSLG